MTPVGIIAQISCFVPANVRREPDRSMVSWLLVKKPYADPRTITSEHCYEHPGRLDQPPGRFVYLKLLSDNEIAVIFGEGSCPESLPDGYRTYYR